MRAVLISALLLIPCLWHPHLVAGDLSSHLYNAWLADMAVHGQAPGVFVVGQTDNVLFDWMLQAAAHAAGFSHAAKIAVPVCVLVFFWGAFTFVAAAARRMPWNLTPALAAIAYGWTFNAGFFNYYLSLGFAFFAIAIAWRGRRWWRLASIPLVALAFVASPLGVAWFAGALAYLIAGENWRGWTRVLLLPAALVATWSAGMYIVNHLQGGHSGESWYLLNGADQLAVYGHRYVFVAAAAFVAGLVMIAADAIARRSVRLPLALVELYVLLVAAAGLLPDTFYVSMYGEAPSFLVPRLTSVTAIVAIAVLAFVEPRRWHLPALAAIAVVFFSFLFADSALLSRSQSAAERAVRSVPRGSRLMFTLLTLPPDWRLRFVAAHVPEPACIGRCWSYQNYEAHTGQFRVRAADDSPVVTTDYGTICEIEHGIYRVQPEDLPAYALYQRTSRIDDLAVRPLRAGEMNGAIGVHEPVDPDESPCD